MEQLYAILLKKNLKIIKQNEEPCWLPKEHAHWIALGHFDDIYSYSIYNDKGFFSSIKEDKSNVIEHNNEKEYYHPLYLIPKSNNNLYNDKGFWFIAIVRIHFPKSTNLTYQFEKIHNELKNKLNALKFAYQINYATEFSDMVLEVQSNRFDVLLNTILRLRENETINFGKMYTYFGINYNLLCSSKPFPYQDDIIPMFSMRFSGYNIEIIKNQIKLINRHLGKNNAIPPEYCINGIDDIMLIYRNRYVTDLVKLYRIWFLDENYKNYRKSESTTRLGIEINIEFTNLPSFKTDKELINSKICKELPELCENISKALSLTNNRKYFGWFHAILEVANSLVTMSRTPIMDEVVYLIAPSVRAFLLNIQEILNNKNQIDFSHYAYLYDFVESCSYYIEQLMRIEGQLSHNPEIRPVLYDIPVFMLEYTIVFLNKVSKLLVHADPNNDIRNTVFLLVPKPCERSSASEIFPANKSIPGLVHIQIPENTLYTPTEVFRSLCHEISHYVGETYRNREKRKYAYCHAIASLVTVHVFHSYDEAFLHMFKKLFLDALNEYPNPTIKEMHSVIQKIAYETLMRNDSMKNILEKYFEYTRSKCIQPEYIEYLNDDEIQNAVYFIFETRVCDIDILFREVFADLCMLYILDLEIDEYIESLLQEMNMYPDKNNISLETLAIRIYATLKAIGKDVKYNGMNYRHEWNKVYKIIEQISEEIDENTEGKYKLPLTIASILSLKEYSVRCYDTISKLLPESETISVKQMYTDLSSDNFEYKNILKEIEKHRENVIKQTI